MPFPCVAAVLDGWCTSGSSPSAHGKLIRPRPPPCSTAKKGTVLAKKGSETQAKGSAFIVRDDDAVALHVLGGELLPHAAIAEEDGVVNSAGDHEDNEKRERLKRPANSIRPKTRQIMKYVLLPSRPAQAP